MGSITRSGAYVIQPTSMKALSFVEFIRSYNFIDDYSKVEALVDPLSNAVKYTPQGGSIRLTVNESLLPDGKIRLLYRVADTGLGMSEEFQAEMYNMFARETDSRINNTQGTGLVLPIVKQLVDLMRGTSTCDSALGKGTTFTVTLYLEKSSAEECQHLCPTDEPNGDINDFDDIRVMVAEDNDLNWEIIEEMLRQFDIPCDRTHNEKECVHLLSETPKGTYDLILMDVQACLDAGMNAHIAKPVDIKKSS